MENTLLSQLAQSQNNPTYTHTETDKAFSLIAAKGKGEVYSIWGANTIIALAFAQAEFQRFDY